MSWYICLNTYFLLSGSFFHQVRAPLPRITVRTLATGLDKARRIGGKAGLKSKKYLARFKSSISTVSLNLYKTNIAVYISLKNQLPPTFEYFFFPKAHACLCRDSTFFYGLIRWIFDFLDEKNLSSPPLIIKNHTNPNENNNWPFFPILN